MALPYTQSSRSTKRPSTSSPSPTAVLLPDPLSPSSGCTRCTLRASSTTYRRAHQGALAPSTQRLLQRTPGTHLSVGCNASQRVGCNARLLGPVLLLTCCWPSPPHHHTPTAAAASQDTLLSVGDEASSVHTWCSGSRALPSQRQHREGTHHRR